MNGVPLHSVHSLINHDNSNHQRSNSQSNNYLQSQSQSSSTGKRPAQSAAQSSADRPSKRSRKAINCEPCRASKLKCDRGRPCSGCVLRNTVAQCYADAGPFEDGPSTSTSSRPTEDFSRIDPRAEITRIRNSLAVIESHINRTAGYPPTPANSNPGSLTPSTTLPPISQLADYSRQPRNSLAPIIVDEAPPKPSESGFFTGTSSLAGTLFTLRKDTTKTEGDEDRSSNGDGGLYGRFEDPSSPPLHPVEDLFQYLPDVTIIDTLIDHYFECSIWIHRHLHQDAFRATWANFKAQPQGNPKGHIILATVFCVLAISTQYLYPNHSIITATPYSQPDLGDYYFGLAETAWRRHRQETKALCMDLIEFLLLKVHYLNISKRDCEAIWILRGQLVSFGTAMGLHRDPGKWKMSEETVERRRWAWWNILTTDRWQSFLFGRPSGISSHHYDTQYPMSDYYDPKQKAVDHPDLPYLIPFKLAAVMGDILDDSLSVRPIPYERIVTHDLALQSIIDSMPPDMAADDYLIAKNITSSGITGRRLAAQTIVTRAALYHIRFALHRPYTTPQSVSASSPNKDSEEDEVPDSDFTNSFNIAVKAANDLIQLMNQASPDYCTNPHLAVPGHLSWGAFHLFSAAMFFVSQLIWRPSQHGCKQFRHNVRKTMDSLMHVKHSIILAQKAFAVLEALQPMWEEPDKTEHISEQQKAELWAATRKLAVPCHDSPIYPTNRGVGGGSVLESPSAAMMRNGVSNSPTNSISPSAMGMLPTPAMSHPSLMPSAGNTPIQTMMNQPPQHQVQQHQPQQSPQQQHQQQHQQHQHQQQQQPPPPPTPQHQHQSVSQSHSHHHSHSVHSVYNGVSAGGGNPGMNMMNMAPLTPANSSHGSMVVGPPLRMPMNSSSGSSILNTPSHSSSIHHLTNGHQQEHQEPLSNHIHHTSHHTLHHPTASHPPPPQSPIHQVHHQPQQSAHGSMQQQYSDPTADEALWSASLGLYQSSDWTNIISGVIRPSDGRAAGYQGGGYEH